MPNDYDPQKTLWMLVYDDGSKHQLKAFYAVSEKDAQSQAQQWLEKLPDTVIPINLHAYPRGFTIVSAELPGKV
jgi:hypothetical protein